MIKNTKNAFTLIELLGTILILSALVLIVSPLIINQVSKAKANISEQTKKNIVASATNWANDNKKYLPDKNKDSSIYIDLLQKEGYLEEDIPNVDDGDCVLIINRDNVYYYEYHNKEDTDNQGNQICDYYSTFKRVDFDAQTNGGTLIGSTPVYVHTGSALKLPEAKKENGYNFIGWSTNKNATSGIKDTYYTVTENIKFYAIYKKPAKTYTVTTNANGGVGTSRSSSCQISEVYNNEVQKTSCPAVLPNNSFTKNGYLFNGWGTTSSGGTIYDEGDTISLNSNKTVYANWKLNSYTLTYNYSYNGGTSADIHTSEMTVGDQVDLSVSAYKSGWTFVGWNTNKDATTALSSYTMPEENITLYAIYKKDSKSYRITTNGNGGSGTTKYSTCTIPAVYNNDTQKTSCTAVLPSNPYTRSGYSFNGWSTSSSASTGLSAVIL